MKRRCRLCNKKLSRDEFEYCDTCLAFLKRKYKDKLDNRLDKIGRWK